MADIYPLGLCKEVDSEKKISLVGNVDGTFERGVILNDTTGKCKVLEVPKSVTGLIEVWGDANRNHEIVARGYTTFTDVNFDFDSHIQIIEYMRKFKDLN